MSLAGERIRQDIEAERRLPTLGELQLRANTVEEQVQELEAERDALRAQLAESEAGAAAMRDALTEALGVFDAANDCPCPDCAEARCVLQRIQSVLSSSAGRDTAERLRLLGELAEAATAFTERCTLVECNARDDQDDCGDWDACPFEWLEQAVQAVKGGDADAGTEA